MQDLQGGASKNPMITFDSTTHTYTLNGEVVPSVTQMLDVLTYEDYGKIDKAVLEYASRRGTDVHEATMEYDLTDSTEVDAEIEPYVRAYAQFVADYKPNYFGIEEVVSNEQYRYAGTVDRYGVMDGVQFVLDIKTVASPNRMTYIKTALQTYLYEIAIGGDFGFVGSNLYVLFLRKDGTYRLVDLKKWWGKHMPDELYKSALNIIKIKNLIKEIKEI